MEDNMLKINDQIKEQYAAYNSQGALNKMIPISCKPIDYAGSMRRNNGSKYQFCRSLIKGRGSCSPQNTKMARIRSCNSYADRISSDLAYLYSVFYSIGGKRGEQLICLMTWE